MEGGYITFQMKNQHSTEAQCVPLYRQPNFQKHTAVKKELLNNSSFNYFSFDCLSMSSLISFLR